MTAGQYQIVQLVIFILFVSTFLLYVYNIKRNHWIVRGFLYSIMFGLMLLYYRVQPSTSDYVDMVSRDHMEIYYNHYHCKAKLNHVSVADSLHLILTEKCNLKDIKNNFKL